MSDGVDRIANALISFRVLFVVRDEALKGACPLSDATIPVHPASCRSDELVRCVRPKWIFQVSFPIWHPLGVIEVKAQLVVPDITGVVAARNEASSRVLADSLAP